MKNKTVKPSAIIDYNIFSRLTYIDVKLKNGRVWRFNYSKKYKKHIYTTKKNVYILYTELRSNYDKIWIGRVYGDIDGLLKVFTVENYLRVEEIKFLNGRYVFDYDKKKKTKRR